MPTIAGIRLDAPVILAAGTAGVLDEMSDVLDLSPAGGIGAVISKSITPHRREGNQTWRILPAGSVGMLNAIGLANPGIESFINEYLPRVQAVRTNVFVSVAGFSADDYKVVASAVDAWSAAHQSLIKAIELNVSCPNVKTGVEFGGSPELIRELLGHVRPHVGTCKLIVKLSPLTSELVPIARAAVEAGADALTLCNTIPAMAIDVRTRRPKLANITGGLSGPAVHPVVVRHIYEVYRKVAKESNTPILGLGGVCNWQDAAEFVLAGASAVQVGTMLFADAAAPKRIAKGLAAWCRQQGKPDLQSLVGGLVLEAP